MNDKPNQLNNRFIVVSYSIFIFLNLSFTAFFLYLVLKELLGISVDPHGYNALGFAVLLSFLNFITCSAILVMMFLKKNKRLLLVVLLTFLNSFALLAGYFFIIFNVIVIWVIAIDIIRYRRIRDNSNAEDEPNMQLKHTNERKLSRNQD